MRRFSSAWLPCFMLASACSGGAFDVASTEDASAADALADGHDVVDDGGDDAATDAARDVPIAVDAPIGGCTPVVHATTDVFVNGTAKPGGTGSAGCPFRTLKEASLAPLAFGVTRTVHVAPGLYAEAEPIRVRNGETYRVVDGANAKIVPGGTAKCAPIDDTCAVQLDPGAGIDGFVVESSAVSHGVVVTGTTGARARILNTSLRALSKDGILVAAVGADIGPNVHADGNGASGLLVRNGSVRIFGPNTTFDGNKGFAGVTMRGGIVEISGKVTARANANGVVLDGAGGSTAEIRIDGLTASGNKNAGLSIAKTWTRVRVRGSTLTNNGVGLFAEWNGSGSNTFDLGTKTDPGNNVLGGASLANARAALMLCNLPKLGSQSADANTWKSCPPSESAHGSCDTFPPNYADVVLVPVATVTVGSALAPMASCAEGP